MRSHQVFFACIAGCLLVGLAHRVTAQPSALRVTLLGTGTPEPRPDRFGPRTLVEAGSERLVFDCGRSCTTRLWQLGIPDLWLTGWLTQPYGTRTQPFQVWGPRGTSAMMAALQAAYQEDIRVRRAFNPNLTAAQVGVNAHDIREGIVYEDAGVRVTAFKVKHAEFEEAFGFRVDYGGRSVAISGDMAPNDNFLRHARGADVIAKLARAMERPSSAPSSSWTGRCLTKAKFCGWVFGTVSATGSWNVSGDPHPSASRITTSSETGIVRLS